MKVVATIQRYKLYHLLIWGSIFGLWYFFRHQDYSSNQLAFRVTSLKVVDLAVMVYITNYLLIPQLLYKKKYWLFALCFIVLVFGTSWLKLHIEGLLMSNPRLYDLFKNFKTNFYDNTIPHFLLVSTAAGFKLVLDYAKAQRRLGEMAKENAEAELNFLKSQINPHFVFNSLNSVYFLIDKQNNDARDALHKFSDMLRYQLYECNGEKSTIEKEVSYLEDYIDMQRLRRDGDSKIEFNVSDDVKGFSVEPLLLIPFVENAFKHLSHYSNKCNEVSIELAKQNSLLKFKVTNTTEPKVNGSIVATPGGIGLKNVKRRLELLYPGKHSLAIDNSNGMFSVVLDIDMSN